MALYIDRKIGQSILITDSNGKKLKVTVQRTKGSEVRLSCEGDREVRVDRLENRG